MFYYFLDANILRNPLKTINYLDYAYRKRYLLAFFD